MLVVMLEALPVNVTIPAFKVPVPVIALPEPANELTVDRANIRTAGVLIVAPAAVPD